MSYSVVLRGTISRVSGSRGRAAEVTISAGYGYDLGDVG
jgi:hypothetical protein